MESNPQVQAPMPQRVAKPPLAQTGVWTAFGSLLVLLSLWLFVAAVGGSLALFTNSAPTFDSLLSLLIPHLSSFAGVTIAAFGSTIAAVAAFMIFNRAVKSNTPVAETPLRITATISGLQATLLAISAFGVALTPLLTIQEGMDVGSVYLVQFLPLALGAILFAGLTYYLLRALGGRVNLGFVSLLALAASVVALTLGVVSVAVKSHDDNYRGGSSSQIFQYKTPDTTIKKDTPTTTGDSSTSTKKNDTTTEKEDTTKKSTSGASTTECVDQYKNGKISASEYLQCYQDAYARESDQ